MAKKMAMAKMSKMSKMIGKVMKDEPATLLVWGFKQHGKSSFIDSVVRFMYEEDLNLVRRAGSRAPDMYYVHHVLGVGENEEDDDESHEDDEDYDFSKDVLVRLVDSPTVASEEESKAELSRVLKQGVWHKMRMNEEERHAKGKFRLRPECVVLVVSCMGCNMAELRALADIIHGTGTPFVVAVTHKDRTTTMRLSNYLMQVADACRNESVFCLENYVQRPDQSELEDVQQNDKANRAMSKLLLQTMHYIWEDRLNNRLYSNKCCEEGKDHHATTEEGSHNPYPEANVRSSHESFEFL